MKPRLYSFIALLAAVIPSCQNSLSSSGSETALQGQVYSIGHPGPIPEGWTPPPLKQVQVVLVLNSAKTLVRQVTTDVNGRFKVHITPGTYYLRVKDSPVPAETGPYTLHSGHVLAAEAHYDNAMR